MSLIERLTTAQRKSGWHRLWTTPTLYLLNWLLILDLAGNCLLGKDPRLTISATAGTYANKGRCAPCRWLCAALNWVDRDHCAQAAVRDWPEIDRSIWK